MLWWHYCDWKIGGPKFPHTVMNHKPSTTKQGAGLMQKTLPVPAISIVPVDARIIVDVRVETCGEGEPRTIHEYSHSVGLLAVPESGIDDLRRWSDHAVANAALAAERKLADPKDVKARRDKEAVERRFDALEKSVAGLVAKWKATEGEQ
jgi:hypothetical protein